METERSPNVLAVHHDLEEHVVRLGHRRRLVRSGCLPQLREQHGRLTAAAPATCIPSHEAIHVELVLRELHHPRPRAHRRCRGEMRHHVAHLPLRAHGVTVRTAGRVALVVGTLLSAVEQGATIVDGDATWIT